MAIPELGLSVAPNIMSRWSSSPPSVFSSARNRLPLGPSSGSGSGLNIAADPREFAAMCAPFLGGRPKRLVPLVPPPAATPSPLWLAALFRLSRGLVPDLFGDSNEEEGDERRSSSPPLGVAVPRFSSAESIGEMVTGCVMTGEIRKLQEGLVPSVRVSVSEAGKEEALVAATAGVMDTLLRLTGSLLTGR